MSIKQLRLRDLEAVARFIWLLLEVWLALLCWGGGEERALQQASTSVLLGCSLSSDECDFFPMREVWKRWQSARVLKLKEILTNYFIVQRMQHMSVLHWPYCDDSMSRHLRAWVLVCSAVF